MWILNISVSKPDSRRNDDKGVTGLGQPRANAQGLPSLGAPKTICFINYSGGPICVLAPGPLNEDCMTREREEEKAFLPVEVIEINALFSNLIVKEY